MARLYSRSSKGRKVLLSSPKRTTRSRDTNHSHSTSGKTHPVPSTSTRLAPAHTPTMKRKKTSAKEHDNTYGSEGEATSDSAEDADGDDDDEEDDEEEPEFYAPSPARKMQKTGRKISPMEYEQRLFGGSDDEDDDVYEAVNDISDSDDDSGEKQEEAYFIQDLKSMGCAVFESETEEDPTSILDNIDTMSFLGFDGDLDLDGVEGPLSFSDDSDSNTEIAYDAVVERHVHFPSDIDQPYPHLTASVSPLMTRALLPSALPKDTAGDSELHFLDHPFPRGDQRTSSQLNWLDEDDSEATDEDLPAEAHTTPNNLHNPFVEQIDQPPSSPPVGKNGKKSTPRRKGPRRGFFQVDKDKPWAILDPTGKKIVLLPAPDTDRHDWLETRTPGASTNASPSTSFAQLLDESDGSVTSSQENIETAKGATVDVMLASLNSIRSKDVDRGQAVGPAEAFFPNLSAGYQIVGDYLIEDTENLDNISDASNEGDLPFTIDNLIEFDDEDDANESPTSPIFMPPMHELSGGGNLDEEFPHLNNRNVTAFRDSTDPTRAALNRRLPTPELGESSGISQMGMPELHTPVPSRKRKVPYSDKTYDGVTPVQRKIISTTKRRKVMT